MYISIKQLQYDVLFCFLLFQKSIPALGTRKAKP